MPDLLYPLCCGFVGDTTSIKFISFLQEYEKSYSAEDVADSYPEHKENINKILNEDKKNDLIEKIMIYVERELDNITLRQVDNISAFVKDCPDEMIVNFFNLIMETKQEVLIRKFHKHFGMLVTRIVRANPNFCTN